MTRWMAGTAAIALTLWVAPAWANDPGWFLQTTTPDPSGKLQVGPGGKVLVDGPKNTYPMTSGSPSCSHSPICDNPKGGLRGDLQRVEWKQTPGYTYAYPFDLPQGGGGSLGAAIDSKGNIWTVQRNAPGKPELFEFDSHYKLVRAVPESVIGHLEKAHGIAVDAHDNVWIGDANAAVVMGVSPEGRLIKTIGIKDRRGDWDEAKGQRLLWQPLDMAFAPNGDMYIGEGHGNESPNDVGASPENMVGSARVIHLDKDGKFLGQWYGTTVGPGKFSMAHGVAVDPKTGNVWVADREQYRLVVFTAEGKFIKTVQMRNLTCAVAFDPRGNLWVATGQDGQVIRIDQDGKVLAATGNGSGFDKGQFIESNFMAWDKAGNLFVGDTSMGRVTEIIPPK